MLFSYSWLKQFVDIDKKPQELADDLSCKSVEINSIDKFGGDFLEEVVVGEIKEILPHPNADKLKLTKVDIGGDVLDIVCGAPNIEVGQKVPVALVGCKLPMGEIKEAKIRGVESFGMLAAEDELALGDDHTGIMILDDSLELGKKLSDIYNDYVFDGEITAQRGDLLNHFGFAREISAIYNEPLKEENIFIKDKGDEINKYLDVVNDNLEICPVYTARMIKNIRIGSSPIWMQQRLLAAGMRPINNVVDITNYVMLEYGNPLHAFDATKIKKDEYGKHKIVVRKSEKGDKIRTLDGENHELPEGLLVISDLDSPVAVAGIMGGENSEIDYDTSTVILESATFNPSLIRKGQRELGLRTEASGRFEKGLSTYLAKICLDRAAKLFEEICGGEIVPGKIVAGNVNMESKHIEVDIEKMKKYISVEIDDKSIGIILDNLGIKNEFRGDNLVCQVPQWRTDMGIWQDIAEEVGRIYGYDRVPEDDLDLKIEPKTEKVLYFEQSAKKYLAEQGLVEVFSYSILSDNLVEKTKMDNRYFEVMNPLNENDYIMRSGLWNGLLAYISENAKKSERLTFFDLSKVYLEGESKGFPAKEERRLAIAIYGEREDLGIYVLKKYLDDFSEKFELKFDYNNDPGNKNYSHPGRSAEIFYKKEKVGRISEIHPQVLERLDIKKRVWCAEINFDVLADYAENIENKFQEIESEAKFSEYSRYEVSKRDMAILVDEKVDNGEVMDIIKDTDEKITVVDLFDEYKSNKFGEGKRSLAYHLIFQAKDRTLNDREVDELFNKILDNLEKKIGAGLRK